MPGVEALDKRRREGRSTKVSATVMEAVAHAEAEIWQTLDFFHMH
jgi:hypothetical protein